MDIQLFTYGAVALTVAVLGFFLIRNKYGKGKAASKIDDSEEEPRDPTTQRVIYPDTVCRIYDNQKRKRYEKTLKSDDINAILDNFETMGRSWDIDGRMLYALVKADKSGDTPYGNKKHYYEGDFIPMEFFLDPSRENPPGAVHTYTNLPEMGITHDVTVPLSMFQKYGGLLWLAGCIGFIIFMMVSPYLKK